MTSGINWKYKVTNANASEPPISYCIGLGWASGETQDLTVGLVSGLDAVRTAYASLPGLGYHRQLWLNAKLSGPEQVACAASKYLLDIAAKKAGKKSPLVHGGVDIEYRTIGDWINDNGFVNGAEIAQHAGIELTDSFLDVWERFAIAAAEWPREKWGVCPKVTKLKVVDISQYGKHRECGNDEAARVLDAAEAWGRAVNTRDENLEAGKELASLINEEVVKAAVAVTKKRGSVSGLRHALRVGGYLD